MRIIHTSVLVWIIIVLTTVYIRKLVINTYRFDHNETLVASCLHTVASQDICAVCNVNTIPRLKHKGFSLHSDTPLHLIRYSERDKISCQQVLQMINFDKLRNQNVLELEKIPAIATLVELFYVHLKSSTEKLLHFPVNYGDFVAVQVGPQRKLVTVNYSTPSPAAQRLMVSHLIALSFIGCVTMLLLGIYKHYRRLAVQMNEISNLLAVVVALSQLLMETDIDFNSRVFLLPISLFFVAILSRQVQSKVLLLAYVIAFQFCRRTGLVLMMQAIVITIMMWAVYKELRKGQNDKSSFQMFDLLPISSAVAFFANQCHLRTAQPHQQLILSQIFQMCLLIIVPLATQISLTIKQLELQKNKIQISTADEQQKYGYQTH